MGSQQVRTTLSTNNKYYISKERRLELKHFCLQYHEWLTDYYNIKNYPDGAIDVLSAYAGISRESFVEKQAIKAAELSKKIDMVRNAASDTDPVIGDYILEAVTEDKSFGYFEANQIPCGRDMFYDRYRKFFWLLDKVR